MKSKWGFSFPDKNIKIVCMSKFQETSRTLKKVTANKEFVPVVVLKIFFIYMFYFPDDLKNPFWGEDRKKEKNLYIKRVLWDFSFYLVLKVSFFNDSYYRLLNIF